MLDCVDVSLRGDMSNLFNISENKTTARLFKVVTGMILTVLLTEEITSGVTVVVTPKVDSVETETLAVEISGVDVLSAGVSTNCKSP